MAIRFKLFGQEVYIGKRLYGVGVDTEDYYRIMSSYFGTDTKQGNYLKAYRGIVYGCVKLIGDSCSSYEPVIKTLKGDRWESLKTHKFIDLLEQPHGMGEEAVNFSKSDLFRATASFLALQGECYWYMAKGRLSGEPKEIIILRPDKVGVDVDKKTGAVNGYFIRRNAGSPIPLKVDEVLHFLDFDPEDPYHGMGTVEGGHDYIEADKGTSAYTKNFFRNNAGITGILTLNGEITKDAFKKFVRKWREKHEGTENFGKTAAIRGTEANFTKMGLGLNELDMSGLKKMSQEDVAMMFRVPLPLLGKMPEGAGFGRANIEALEYIFAKWNIEFKFKAFDDILQFALMRYYGMDPKTTKVDHQSIIPEDKEHELNKRDKGVDRWVTRNEIRDEDGLDDIEGGEQLFVDINKVPVNTDLTMAPDTQQEETPPAKSVKLVIRKAESSKKKEFSSVAKENFRLRLQRNQIVYERRYRKKFEPVMRKQLAEALNNLEAHASSLTKDMGDSLFDKGEYTELMVTEISPVLHSLAEQQGALALVFAGDDENKFRMTVNMANILKNGTKRMADNFNAETLKRLNDTLSEGIALGEALGKLKKRVEAVYTAANGYRSLRLARTETLKASNSASVEAYRQTGYVKAKQWYVNPGACEICEAMSGKEIGLDETFLPVGSSVDYTDSEGNEQSFSVSYDDVEEPPLHPNCRCTIIPIR